MPGAWQVFNRSHFRPPAKASILPSFAKAAPPDPNPSTHLFPSPSHPIHFHSHPTSGGLADEQSLVCCPFSARGLCLHLLDKPGIYHADPGTQGHAENLAGNGCSGRHQAGRNSSPSPASPTWELRRSREGTWPELETPTVDFKSRLQVYSCLCWFSALRVGSIQQKEWVRCVGDPVIPLWLPEKDL